MRTTMQFLAALVLIGFSWETLAQDLSATVRAKAEECGQATIKGDWGKLADLTHPLVVEKMGGRQKMIAQVEAGAKQMQAQGLQFKSHKVGEPSSFVKSGADLFTTVPTVLQIATRNGVLSVKSFLIGVSTDGGKNWVFIDGGAVDRETIKAVLPNFPQDLKLPEREPPVFEKTK